MSSAARQLGFEFPSSAPAPEPARPVARELEPRPPPSRDEMLEKADGLARRLAKDLGVVVRLAVTDNRSTMVSFRRASTSVRIRVHHMFLDAPAHVEKAIADYAGRGRSRAGDVIDAFIRESQPLIRRDRTGSTLEPRGRCFDLQEIFDAVNQRYFGGAIQATIGWGKMPNKARRRSIRLGVYDHQAREIRIHPALDRPDLPRFFVEFIVFHEMLHQLFPSSNGPGRRVHHPRAFREREKTYPHYAAALAWEKENLRLLLRG
ncbi:MAG: hypothetical protein WBV82_17275 [Myxococcaceae bacterium]